MPFSIEAVHTNGGLLRSAYTKTSTLEENNRSNVGRVADSLRNFRAKGEKMRRILLSAAAAALLVSCVSSGGDAASLVPEDAYAALVVESPAGLFQSAESFVQAAGLDRFTGGKTLRELFLDEAGGGKEFLDAVEVLDFGRPVVLAVLPDRSGTEPGTGTVLWLPLKKDKDAFDRLRASMTGFEGEAVFVGGYAALGLEGPAPAALPARTVDLSRLSAYPADSLKAWINVEALRTDFADGWDSALKDAFRPSPEGGPNLDLEDDAGGTPDEPYNYNERHFDWDEYERESAVPGLPGAGLFGDVDPADLLRKAADNLAALDFAVGADGRGVYVRAGVVPRPGRALDDLASAAGPARGIPFLKYLEADALLGGAASLDPKALGDFAKLYVEALGMEKLLSPAYFELLDSLYASAGADSAFSFDVTVDPDLLAKVEGARSPEEISDLLGRSFAIEASGAGSLRDRELYRSSLERLGKGGIFGEAFRDLAGSSGLTLDLAVASGSIDGIDYDSIRVELGGAGLGSDPADRAVLDALLDKITVYAGYAKNRYFMALGDPAKLPGAVRRDRAVRPLGGDAGYKAFAADLPKETRGVYYLSLKKIFGLAAAFSKDKGMFPAEGLDRLYGYYAAAPGRLETGIFLGSGDVRALVGLIPEGREQTPDIF